ncbi:sigma-54 dependent transcriptional regulator [bacterium]|nr:sigma-54 dependent transcriptional regulator [bacterium]MBU1063376.1 sigma-54 dependent transcriptional regulator [bacterium]MBU1633131.1 sigma-54 dependent transcriptional regulator [bacterium]MBU1874450.1 sigma-54 dependent transcriptional regulator [bacterium]
MEKILIIDDNKSTIDALSQIISEKGYTPISAYSAEDGYKIYKSSAPDMIITDMKLPGMSGLDLLKKIRTEDEAIPMIIITAFGTVKSAVQAVKLGAYDFITKPFSVDEIEIKIDKALNTRRLALKNRELSLENAYLREEIGHEFSEIIGQSAAMQTVFSHIKKVALANSPVLILGDSGTGKELVARAIHFHSNRKDNPFIKVNCAALAQGVLESELFGHEKGSFTGAIRRKPGRFEIAAQGSIFLDEIGEIPADVQVKLLRVLQEKEFERVGGTETLKMNARIIAATNQDLAVLIKSGKFREDLYYRLNVVPITLPSLKNRKEDIPLLVDHFIGKYNVETGRQVREILPEALSALKNYEWPGNIRELENVIERAIVMSTNPQIRLEDLPDKLVSDDIRPSESTQGPINTPGSLVEIVNDFERKLILDVLDENDGNIAKAARKLQIKRTTLRYKIEKYKLLGYNGESD